MTGRDLYVGPDDYEVGGTPNGNIGIRINVSGSDLGLAPGLSLILTLTPAEARALAGRLMAFVAVAPSKN